MHKPPPLFPPSSLLLPFTQCKLFPPFFACESGKHIYAFLVSTCVRKYAKSSQDVLVFFSALADPPLQESLFLSPSLPFRSTLTPFRFSGFASGFLAGSPYLSHYYTRGKRTGNFLAAIPHRWYSGVHCVTWISYGLGALIKQILFFSCLIRIFHK